MRVTFPRSLSNSLHFPGKLHALTLVKHPAQTWFVRILRKESDNNELNFSIPRYAHYSQLTTQVNISRKNFIWVDSNKPEIRRRRRWRSQFIFCKSPTRTLSGVKIPCANFCGQFQVNEKSDDDNELCFTFALFFSSLTLLGVKSLIVITIQILFSASSLRLLFNGVKHDAQTFTLIVLLATPNCMLTALIFQLATPIHQFTTLAYLLSTLALLLSTLTIQSHPLTILLPTLIIQLPRLNIQFTAFIYLCTALIYQLTTLFPGGV